MGYLTTSHSQLCQIREGKNIVESDLLHTSDISFLQQVGSCLEPRLRMFEVEFEHLIEGSFSNLLKESSTISPLTFAVTVFAFQVLMVLSFWNRTLCFSRVLKIIMLVLNNFSLCFLSSFS